MAKRKFTRSRKAEASKPKEKSPKKHETSHTTTSVINGTPCVYVEKGVTKNLGDYNTARVTVGMLLPIDYTPEDLKRAEDAIKVVDEIIINKLKSDVEDLLDEQVDE